MTKFEALGMVQVGEEVTAVGQGQSGGVHLCLLDGRSLRFGQPLAAKVHRHRVDPGVGRTLAVDHLRKKKKE